MFFKSYLESISAAQQRRYWAFVFFTFLLSVLNACDEKLNEKSSFRSARIGETKNSASPTPSSSVDSNSGAASPSPSIAPGSSLEPSASPIYGSTFENTLKIPEMALTCASPGILATSLQLSWQKTLSSISNQDDLEYRVYQSPSNNLTSVAETMKNGTALNNFTANIQQLTAVNLSANTTYYFTVIVRDRAGNRAMYPVLEQKTAIDSIAPEAGGDGVLSVLDVASTSLTLSWVRGSDNATNAIALKYCVYKSLTNNITSIQDVVANGTMIGQCIADIDTAVLNVLSPGTAYYLNVVVKDGNGNLGAFSPISVTTLADPTISSSSGPSAEALALAATKTALAMPVSLTATSGIDHVKLTWSAPTTVTPAGYLVAKSSSAAAITWRPQDGQTYLSNDLISGISIRYVGPSLYYYDADATTQARSYSVFAFNADHIYGISTYGTAAATSRVMFSPALGFDSPGVDIMVEATDGSGKMYLCGRSSTYSNKLLYGPVRLNSDGSIDFNFVGHRSAPSSDCGAIIPQSDGKVIIGNYGDYDGVTVPSMIRLNSDGSRDLTYSVPGVVTDVIDTFSGDLYMKNTHGASRFSSDGTALESVDFGLMVEPKTLVWDAAISKLYYGGVIAYGNPSQNRFGRRNSDLSIDSTFVTGTGFDSGVTSIVLDPTTHYVYVGGGFANYNGVACGSLVRLKTDGSLDTSFSIGTGPNVSIGTFRLDSVNNKIYVSGGFSTWNGSPRAGIARLNTDGSLDMSYSPIAALGPSNGSFNSVGNFLVNSITGDLFTAFGSGGGWVDVQTINGIASPGLAQIASNGSIRLPRDPSFTANVLSAAIDGTTGNVYVAPEVPYFNRSIGFWGPTQIGRVARILPDGTYDSTFVPPSNFGTNERTTIVEVDPATNKIYVAAHCDFRCPGGIYNLVNLRRYSLTNGSIDGSFTTIAFTDEDIKRIVPSVNNAVYLEIYNSSNYSRVVKRLVNGVLDPNWPLGTGLNYVKSVFPLSDGKAYIYGDFTAYNGTATPGFARLNFDGTIDSTFNIGTGFDGDINSVSIDESTGKLYVIGVNNSGFTHFNGSSVKNIVRLNSDGSKDNSFNFQVDLNTEFEVDYINFGTAVVSSTNHSLYVFWEAYDFTNWTQSNLLVKISQTGGLDRAGLCGNGRGRKLNIGSGSFGSGFFKEVAGKLYIGGLGAYDNHTIGGFARLTDQCFLD